MTSVLLGGIVATAVPLQSVRAVSAPARDAMLSAQEWRLFVAWRDGRDDARIQGLADGAKLQKIASSVGVSVAQLKSAIARGQQSAPTLGADTERTVKSELSSTPLSGRILEVHVDASQGHVVAGIKWRCGDLRDVDKEAAYAAWAAASGGGVVQTLVVWCVNDRDAKLFSGTIGRTAFEKISKPGIERFAASRYIRLFEDVKRGPHA